jgi:hypothetical protein
LAISFDAQSLRVIWTDKLGRSSNDYA